MAPRNHGKSSGKPKCPGCSHHFEDLRRHVLRIHRTTISELQRRQQNITIQRLNESPNSHQETPHVSALTREENLTDSTNSLHQESLNSRQKTPSLHSDGNLEHVLALTSGDQIKNAFETYILKTTQFYQRQLKRKEISSDECFNNTEILNALKSRIVKIVNEIKRFSNRNNILEKKADYFQTKTNSLIKENKALRKEVKALRKENKAIREVIMHSININNHNVDQYENEIRKLLEIDNDENAIKECLLPCTFLFIVNEEDTEDTGECSNSNHRNNGNKGDVSKDSEENSDNEADDGEENCDDEVNDNLEESD
ncbi:8712_t:CDS:2, partial [Racocetra fulgida]